MAAITAKEDYIARSFLRQLHAPITAPMVAAVVIWLRHETGGNVIGNNPWNQHYGSACLSPNATFQGKAICRISGAPNGIIGNRYAGSGDKNVAVFGDLDSGVAAAVRLLTSDFGAQSWVKYDKVVAAARAGNPLQFLYALGNSAWSAGRYRLNGVAGGALVAEFGRLGYTGSVSGTYDPGAIASIGGVPSSGTTASATASAVASATLPANFVKDVLGKTEGAIMTTDDVDRIIHWVQQSGGINWLGSLFPAFGLSSTIAMNATLHEALDPMVGKPINSKALATAVASAAAKASPVTNPLDGLASIAKTFSDFFTWVIGAFGWLLDAKHWLGMALMLLGLFLFWKGFSGLMTGQGS